MSVAQAHSRRPVIIAGIITALYAFSPLIFLGLHSAATIPIMSSGIFMIPNGLYCLMLFASHGAAVFSLVCLWLLLWGIVYLLIRLYRRMRAGKRTQ